MAEISTIEPTFFYAGDTVKWKKSLPGFPATSYTLKYILVNQDNHYVIDSTADGNDHLVEISADTSATYTAGEYRWRSYVDNVGTFVERYALNQGVIEIKANLTTATSGYDWRSTAKKVVDALEAALAGDTTATNLLIISQSCGDLNVSRKADVHAELMKWRNIYQAELEAENIAAGRSTSRAIYTRFNSK